MSFRETDHLVVVDVQRDFCPGGALAVPGGDEVVAPVNRLLAAAPASVVTQDWHPPGHVSFASTHPGRRPFEAVELPYGPQTLWPDHCIQGTAGASFAHGLDTDRSVCVVRKGTRQDVDSYSAFFENDRRTPTGLGGWLRERGAGRVFFAGLALDFCVLWSALDARRLGFEAAVVLDACRALDADGSEAAALTRLSEAGVALFRVEELV